MLSFPSHDPNGEFGNDYGWPITHKVVLTLFGEHKKDGKIICEKENFGKESNCYFTVKDKTELDVGTRVLTGIKHHNQKYTVGVHKLPDSESYYSITTTTESVATKEVSFRLGDKTYSSFFGNPASLAGDSTDFYFDRNDLKIENSTVSSIDNPVLIRPRS